MSIRQIVEEMISWPVRIVIPIEPPNVNNYVKHTRSGRHYKTKVALNWEAICRQTIAAPLVEGKAHEVEYVVFQGSGSRGDVDNYAKCIMDALVHNGVLRSDASVVAIHGYKERDREFPRTEIRVRPL